MNSRQLQKMGVPADCVKDAHKALELLRKADRGRKNQVRELLQAVVADPKSFLDDDQLCGLAKSLLVEEEPPRASVRYRTWGKDGIDEQSHQQMYNACSLPIATAGALMPDAHIGYGLPIGGVLACENAVIPYAVGVDIACRMKMSVLDMPTHTLDSRFNLFKESLQGGTVFGVGKEWDKRQSHRVMDQNWSVSRVTRERKTKAWKQLGTSGSGNHFVEFGELTLEARDDELGLDAGKYVALLSHSGSRGTGAAVCSTYSDIARSRLPKKHAHYGRLAWLDLDTEAGREYWAAMNLMGDYASANHDVIHRLVTKLLGAEVIAGVENHHNFAWKETHGGKDVIVHRKGATPAGAGVLGVIPGSMADPAFVVRGKGNAESLNSAAHGAGRRMSRKKAKSTYRWNAVRKDLEKKGVRVLSAGADEVPGVYKDIRTVMSEQSDLVDIVARFDPKIVRMCGDGSRPED